MTTFCDKVADAIHILNELAGVHDIYREPEIKLCNRRRSPTQDVLYDPRNSVPLNPELLNLIETWVDPKPYTRLDDVVDSLDKDGKYLCQNRKNKWYRSDKVSRIAAQLRKDDPRMYWVSPKHIKEAQQRIEAAAEAALNESNL
jgi:hypothetical protein